MSKLFGLILSFLSICVFSNEPTEKIDQLDVDQQKTRLSVKYTKGPILIYDCLDKHWVCTDKVEAKNCNDKRRYEELEKNENYPCAVFETFETNKQCIKKQKELIDQAIHVIFCVNPKFKNV